MPKLTILLFFILISISFAFLVSANSQDIVGYIYSENAGWISLNCLNTDSCNLIDYKIIKDNENNLIGYGYSQNVGWINFNPNYGGASVNLDGMVSGWVWSEKAGWVRLDNLKIISLENLQKGMLSLEEVANTNDLPIESTMSLLNNMCKIFFSENECNIITK
ncbi:MAG: hypothetical protein WC711_02620 [Candidatus Staskawiczbacteria bacterium]|jgi:hypothetical protein